MGFLGGIKKIGKKIGGALKKIGKFAAPILKGVAGMAGGPLGSLLGKLGPIASKFLQNTGIGKLAQKLVPNLLKKVEDFLNPAKLAASFGGARGPGDFNQLLQGALKNLPGFG